MIYLDNASTTRPFDELLENSLNFQKLHYFNPSATYSDSTYVKTLINRTRKEIASSLNVTEKEIFFTSGATEANNWILENAFKNKKGNIVISAGEHASVYESSMRVKSKGQNVRIAPLLSSGMVDCDSLIDLVDENTCLVSVIHCSNETGVVNNVEKLSKLVKAKNSKTLFHSDGVQAYCKFNYTLPDAIDFYTISAHKINGMKGIGAIYKSKNVNIAPYIVGGGQEMGLRSGTENTVAIVAFYDAIMLQKKYCDIKKFEEYYFFISNFLTSSLANFKINGEHTSLHSIMSVSVLGIKSEILQHLLEDKHILIGLGSACSSKNTNNRVLTEMGLSKKEIEGNIRISFGVYNTMEEIKTFCKELVGSVNELRGKING